LCAVLKMGAKWLALPAQSSTKTQPIFTDDGTNNFSFFIFHFSFINHQSPSEGDPSIFLIFALMSTRDQKLEAFGRLLDIMDDLRAKCPWDKKQTLESLRHLTIEEVYELTDAILDKDMDELKGEIGDIMLHMVFYAKIASETNTFDIADSLTHICEKLISRHPHIYGDVEVADEEEVKQNWEKLKLKEGKKSVLEGVPASLPSMVKASRIQDKARGVGFDWEKDEQVWEKVEEELQEFKLEADANTPKMEEEFGDLLFSLINFARFKNINPDDALEKTNRKFIKRFQYLESESAKDGKTMGTMSLEEMDVYWERAKSMS
jgi:XTP/dITP diphosphohydrolase